MDTLPDPADAPLPAPVTRWLTIVGIGEDGVAGLSPRATEAVSRASLVIGGRRHLALAPTLLEGESRPWMSPIEDSFPMLLARRGKPTCILASGDPFHFGIGATLARLLPAAEITCFPHASAFSLAAARLGWPLQDCCCVTLHGRALRRIVPVLQPRRRVLALSWDRTTPRLLADFLCERGFGPSAMVVCDAMGGDGEQMRHATAATFDLAAGADLNTVALDLRAAPGARFRPSAPGLPDDWFEHDGQITKAPVRAATLAALAPAHGETLWDVGSGSGSVGIEWLLSEPSTTAIAIDRRADRLARAGRNAAAWGVGDRLTFLEGDAPGCLRDLPRPHAVFVGGGLTSAGILDACLAALEPGGRFVANAVTLESQRLLSEAYGQRGGELMMVSIATAEPVGAFHGFRPAMPVMQWRWAKP